VPRFLARQLVLFIPTILILTFFVFALIHLTPGDPATALLGDTASPEAIQAFRDQMNLDDPMAVQYFRWLGRAMTGDLGTSIRTNQPVWNSIIERLPVTLQLAAYAMIIGVVFGIPLGILAAIRNNSKWDLSAQIVALTGLALPNFFLAILLILFVALRFDFIPVAGYVSLQEDPVRHIRAFILPSFALGFALVGVVTRMTRTSMLEVLGENYIQSARAKGLRETTVVIRHGLRNALIPVVTLLGLHLGNLLGGTIIIESIFGLPGVGRLMIDNIYGRDFPVVQGIILFLALVRLATNLLTDIIYAVLDPQIRYS
jgi:peptide/nickel transport system permease protein